MDNKVTSKERRMTIVILPLFCMLMTSFLLFQLYIQKDTSEMSLAQVKINKQLHLNIRDGKGQFTIKPFSFADVGSDSFKAYFKNEGRNEVVVSFFRLDENGGTDNEIVDTVLAGESKEWVFNNPTTNDSDQYMFTISDASEPLPVVIGEFYITDN